jgi:hypothetical protein
MTKQNFKATIFNLGHFVNLPFLSITAIGTTLLMVLFALIMLPVLYNRLTQQLNFSPHLRPLCGLTKWPIDKMTGQILRQLFSCLVIFSICRFIGYFVEDITNTLWLPLSCSIPSLNLDSSSCLVT